jgi:hypothetical protein
MHQLADRPNCHGFPVAGAPIADGFCREVADRKTLTKAEISASDQKPTSRQKSNLDRC